MKSLVVHNASRGEDEVVVCQEDVLVQKSVGGRVPS